MKSVLRVIMVLFAVLVVGFVVLVQWRANLREAAIIAAYPPEGQFVSVAGRQVHYVQMGEGADLVLIHGASGTTRDMTFGFAAELAQRYRVTVFDRPGMGYSDRARDGLNSPFTTDAESPREQARMLQDAAAAIGVAKPVVLGHSFGGAVALGWALERPDDLSALVIVSGVSNPWPGPLDILYRINGNLIGGALFPPVATAFVPDAYIQSVVGSVLAPQMEPAGYGDEIGPQQAVRRSMMRANGRQVAGLRPHVVEMMPHYGTITVPTEIVHGDADTIVPLTIHSDKLVTQIDGSVLTVLAGAGHMPHHTHRDDVIAAIDRASLRAGLR